MNQVTDQQFEQEVLKSDVPVLVDFYANWCGPCRAAAPIIEGLAEEFQGKAKVVKVDIDTDSKTAAQFGVRSIPFFAIFKGGEKIAEFVGYNDGSKIREALNAALTS